jgi:hypothetical protein
MKNIVSVQRSVTSSHVDPQPDMSGARRTASLVAAAVAIGRLRGEPDTVLQPGRRQSILGRLFGSRTRVPLADPRLEVIRAISAFLTNGGAHIRCDLTVAAWRVGWTPDDLGRTFPGVRIE